MVVINSTDVTVDEAAQQLGLRPDTIHSYIKRGHIKHRGHLPQPDARPRTLIDLEELQEFLKTRPKLGLN